MNQEEIPHHLANCELLNTLGESEIAQIVPLCTSKVFNAGESIHPQGSRVDYLFVVAEGSVALFRRAQGRAGAEGAEVAIDILFPGRVLGWSGLVEPHVATNTPKAMTRSELIGIEGTGLRFLLERDQTMGYAVMKRLAELLASRLRATYGVLDTKI